MPMYRNPAGSGTGGGIPEAPTDGSIYARRGSDATWRDLEVIATSPGVSSPEATIIGFAKGQTYTQTDATGTYKMRDWTFNGTPGANTGWI
jgi:hypothetical protein